MNANKMKKKKKKIRKKKKKTKKKKKKNKNGINLSNTRPSLIHAAIGYRVLAVYKVGQRDIKEDRARRREEKRDRID